VHACIRQYIAACYVVIMGPAGQYQGQHYVSSSLQGGGARRTSDNVTFGRVHQMASPWVKWLTTIAGLLVNDEGQCRMSSFAG